jgi:membrane-bound serine protease (ClpP class)
MEPFLDPNVAYLLLMLGFIVALFALAAPGTGFLEAGAMLVLAVAAYAVYQLGVNLWGLIVLVISLVPFVYAVRKPKSKVFLIIGVLGIAIGSAYLFPTYGFLPAVNWLLALVTSVILGVFVWFVAWKVIQAAERKPLQNPDYIICKVGVAKSTISETGSVQVGGELWSARSAKTIPAGKRVQVISRDGFTLEVVEERQTK